MAKMIDAAILSIAYLPPIQYFAKLIHFQNVFLEASENYVKQTYRNRCVILSANGPLPLVIPVIKARGNHTPIRLVEIDNSTLWQKNHWKTIESAYRTSAYFDFVADVLYPFYTHAYHNLYEFDLMLIKAILSFLSLDVNLTATSVYVSQYNNSLDFRNSIQPKVKQSVDHQISSFEYFQVFSAKFGFVPNLSIIDLLFNEGLMAKRILEESQKKPTPLG
ncbi:MAG: WbqC family protein [Bacteroidales bacterium]